MTSTLGSLPPAAQRRLSAARESSLWSAPVAPGEQAALRSVGFEPVGTVVASIPSWPFAYHFPSGLLSAAGAGRTATTPLGQFSTYYPPDDALTAKRAGGFTRDYIEGTSVIVPDFGFSWQKVVREERERQLVSAVLDRLGAEASALGAHGVVAVRLGWRHRPDLDFGELEVHDVNAVGLAVSARGANFGHEPFTATLSGGEVCALLADGLAPSQVVCGVGVVRADMGNRTRRHMRSLGQVEVPQFSEAVEKSLSIATADLERRGATAGDVIVDCKVDVIFNRIVGAGVEPHTRVLGTAMRRFKPLGRPEVLTVMRLNDGPPKR